MKIQPDITKPQRPKTLVILPDTQQIIFREGYTSETDSTDSGVGDVSKHSSLESVLPISPGATENGTNKAQNTCGSTYPPLSFTNIISSSTEQSSSQPNHTNLVTTRNSPIADSNETVTKEQVLRNEQYAKPEPSTNDGFIRNVFSLLPQPELVLKPNEKKSTPLPLESLKGQDFFSGKHVISIYEFLPCKRHESKSDHFCWNCVEDGCLGCMVERHENHKVYQSIMCYDLLNKEAAVIRQMKSCQKSVKAVISRMSNIQIILVDAVEKWQKLLRINQVSIDQLKLSLEDHLKNLCSICIETEGEFTSYKRMINGLRRLYANGSLTEMHDNANPIRRSLINLKRLNTRTFQAITNAILSETAGRDSIADLIKNSGMDKLSQLSISDLERQEEFWNSIMQNGPPVPPIFESSPNCMAPEIPAILQPLFSGRGVPSPTISESFTFARIDPIRSTPVRVYPHNNWPSTQDQVQMAHFEAVGQLLCSADLIHSDFLNIDPNKLKLDAPKPTPSTSSWIPHTPQPQPPQPADLFVAPPLQKSQSLVALWEQIEQPGPSVAPLVPLPEQRRLQKSFAIPNGRVFEIGFHTARNYSQIKMPVLKLEGRYSGDPAQLCRPWGICCDKKNLIYVADRSKDRIAVFSTDGTLVYAFGTRGDQPGEFNRPAGLAIDFEGRLVIADKDNHRIQVFTTEGEYLFHFGRYGNQHGEFFYPWDVACSSSGHIAVTDTRNHRVQIFTHSGVFIRKYGWESRPSMLRELDSPRGVVFVTPNKLLVTDFNNHRIIQITFGDRVCMDQFNKTTHPKATLNRPQGLTLDAEGNVLVCDSKNDRIVIFSPKGEFRGEFGRRGKEDGQFDRTVDIAVAPDGKIAVVDLHHNRVQIF